MAKADEDEVVVFLDSQGNEISNDPRWYARKQLKSEGVDIEALQAELATLRAQLGSQGGQPVSPQELVSNDEDIEDEESEGDYSDVKGSALVKLAKERGIELSVEGKKLTASEVRKALAAQDAENAS